MLVARLHDDAFDAGLARDQFDSYLRLGGHELLAGLRLGRIQEGRAKKRSVYLSSKYFTDCMSQTGKQNDHDKANLSS